MLVLKMIREIESDFQCKALKLFYCTVYLEVIRTFRKRMGE